MNDKLAGLVKILGITLLLGGLWVFLALFVPEKFLQSANIENLMRRTALYGILGIGVAFVIISSGIDLSIGSLVCLAACLLGLFLKVDYVPMGTAPVWQMDSATKSIYVSQGHGFSKGDYLWFDKDRRNKALLKIESILDLEDSQSQLTVSGELRGSETSSDRKPLAKVCRAFPIQSANEKEVTFGLGFPRLRAQDRVLFVSTGGTPRERTVENINDTESTLLTEAITGISESWQAVPIRRKPLMPLPMAIASVLGISLLIGLIHGLLITRVHLQPFVVTLCGLMIYRGIARWLTQDQTVGYAEHAETIGKISTGRWLLWQGVEGQSFGIPYSFFLFAFFVIVALVLLNLTVWGRHLMAVGRNIEAARYSGINTARVVTFAYLFCALMVGLGGMMHALDSASISPSAFGNFFELYAIAAAVLGGCSLRGGEGSILGVVIGTALMQTLNNAIILLKIPDELEFSIIGAVILIGVIGDEILHRLRRDEG